jgi:hypothetical protein
MCRTTHFDAGARDNCQFSSDAPFIAAMSRHSNGVTLITSILLTLSQVFGKGLRSG